MTTLKMPSEALVNINNLRSCVYGFDQRVEAFGDTGMLQTRNHRDDNLVRCNDTVTESQQPLKHFFLERYDASFYHALEEFHGGDEKPAALSDGARQAGCAGGRTGMQGGGRNRQSSKTQILKLVEHKKQAPQATQVKRGPSEAKQNAKHPRYGLRERRNRALNMALIILFRPREAIDLIISHNRGILNFLVFCFQAFAHRCRFNKTPTPPGAGWPGRR